ncbi:MAG: hypothetical protein R3Y04_04935 [Rikenellaceae bacterium]
MNKRVLAAIDIGSNAIRLIINNVENDNGTIIFKKAAYLRVPIRLGEDVFTIGEIGDEKLTRFCAAMSGFANLMKAYGVEKYRACATSAMREAKNGSEVVNIIYRVCGIKIEIISGREEATTIFEAGNLSNIMDIRKSYLFVDVGGGSTEITIFSNRERVCSYSYPLGTVRMISGAVDKAELQEFKKMLTKLGQTYKPSAIIGSGGNINKVHKLLGKKEKESVNYTEINELYNSLKELTFDQRLTDKGLNSYRADVIMPAMKIFITCQKHCNIDTIIVPKIGLSDGIIRGLYYSE